MMLLRAKQWDSQGNEWYCYILDTFLRNKSLSFCTRLKLYALLKISLRQGFSYHCTDHRFHLWYEVIIIDLLWIWVTLWGLLSYQMKRWCSLIQQNLLNWYNKSFIVLLVDHFTSVRNFGMIIYSLYSISSVKYM